MRFLIKRRDNDDDIIEVSDNIGRRVAEIRSVPQGVHVISPQFESALVTEGALTGVMIRLRSLVVVLLAAGVGLGIWCVSTRCVQPGGLLHSVFHHHHSV